MDTAHTVTVPVTALHLLENQIKTVKENLIRKQESLMQVGELEMVNFVWRLSTFYVQVISRQQYLINKQAEALAKYEAKHSKQSLKNGDPRVQGPASPAPDSGLDVDNVSNDSKDAVNHQDDGQEDSDSYITLSDSSLIVTDTEMVPTPSSSSSAMPRPVLREVYLNRDVSSRYGKQRPGTEHCERNVLIQNTSTFPENITPKTIGNPETNGFHKSPENVFQKSFRLFRESRASRSSIFKSKSEGNIKELIDEEPRPSLVQSLYRGFSSSMNFRYSEQHPPETNKPSSCFLSLGAEVNTLTRNQRSVSQLRRQDTQIKSLPSYLPPSQASLLSCFTAGSGNGLNKPVMSNHRNFMRPRDIKVVVSSIKLSRILTT